VEDNLVWGQKKADDDLSWDTLIGDDDSDGDGGADLGGHAHVPI